LTTDLFVLPRILDAFRLMVSEKMLDMQEPSQAAIITGQPCRGNTSSMMHPVNGIKMSPIMTRERFWGQMRHVMIPTQMATI
jgi:hypothetical protein